MREGNNAGNDYRGNNTMNHPRAGAIYSYAHNLKVMMHYEKAKNEQTLPDEKG